MIRFVPFAADHVGAFALQGPQAPYLKWLTPEIAEAAAQHFAFTGIDEAGIVGSAGIAPVEGGACVAWAMFSERIRAHRFAVTKAVKRGLALHSHVDVIAHIHPEHAKAAAFAEALSFKFKEARPDLHPSGALLHVYIRQGRDG